jgi:hypothetical protein
MFAVVVRTSTLLDDIETPDLGKAVAKAKAMKADIEANSLKHLDEYNCLQDCVRVLDCESGEEIDFENIEVENG